MNRPFEPTQTQVSGFERLLNAFNREGGACEFERWRARLIYVLHGRGCAHAEELADEVFARVEKKLAEGAEIDKLEAYLLEVARFVALEDRRRTRTNPRSLEGLAPKGEPCVDPRQIANEREALAQDRRRERCMKRCWRNLPEAQRKILTDYFSNAGRERIENRKRLALRLEVTLTTLRVEIHRLRADLAECLRWCLARRKIVL